MKWAAGGLAYAVSFLYLLTAVAGAAVALLFHLLVLGIVALFGWLVFRAATSSKDKKPED